MNEDWEELMPDDGDYGITVWEAVRDVAMFFAKIVGVLLAIAFVVALFAYSLWREYAILSLILGQ